MRVRADVQTQQRETSVAPAASLRVSSRPLSTCMLLLPLLLFAAMGPIIHSTLIDIETDEQRLQRKVRHSGTPHNRKLISRGQPRTAAALSAVPTTP